MVWDVIGISEVRRPEECFTTLQSGHLQCHYKANNGQAGVCFLDNRKFTLTHSEGKKHQPQISRTSSLHNKALQTKDSVQVYAQTTSFPDEDTNNFYNDVDETLGKLNHYTTVMGDFNAHIEKRTNPKETVRGKFGFGLRNGQHW